MPLPRAELFVFFFFNDTATTEIYTLSLHDALPIYSNVFFVERFDEGTIASLAARYEDVLNPGDLSFVADERGDRSEEHTSELQSRLHLVCRLLLEKKKKILSHPVQHPRSHLSHSTR